MTKCNFCMNWFHDKCVGIVAIVRMVVLCWLQANERKCIYVLTTFQYIRGLSFETDLSVFYKHETTGCNNCMIE